MSASRKLVLMGERRRHFSLPLEAEGRREGAHTLAEPRLWAPSMAAQRLATLAPLLALVPLLALGCNALLGLDPSPSHFNGGACVGATDCESGHCSEGVCCERPCDGPCESCAGSEGQCRPIGRGEACRGKAGACDGTDSERCKSLPGESCEKNAECSTLKCSSEHVVSEAQGSCVAADCVAYGTDCASDLECCSGLCDGKCGASPCAAGQSFDDEGSCRLVLGEPCNDGPACLSGRCVDGVCCSTACDGLCERCDSDEAVGTCKAAKIDTDPDGDCPAASCGAEEENVKCRTVLAIGSGGAHSCAVLSDGRLRCWGDGHPVETVANSFTVPVGAPGQNEPQLAVGRSHNCVRSDGKVWCWGRNGNGQLGVGDTEPRATPTEVDLGDGATAIDLAAGWRVEKDFLVETATDYTCAVVSVGGSNELRCWGGMDENGNSLLQLGKPLNVVALSAKGSDAVVAVAAGANHTCALFDNHDVWCWPLGAAHLAERSIAHADFPANPVTAIAAGGLYTFALKAKGNVVRWKELGGTSPVADLTDPTRIVVSTGELGNLAKRDNYHACALHTPLAPGGPVVHCWGNLLVDDKVPPCISAPEKVSASAISVGEEFTCALLTPGNVQCWGRNDLGQLGGKLLPEFIPL